MKIVDSSTTLPGHQAVERLLALVGVAHAQTHQLLVGRPGFSGWQTTREAVVESIA